MHSSTQFRTGTMIAVILHFFCVITHGQIAINEILADARTASSVDGSVSDWVELFNPGSQPVSLQGWSLTDSADTPRRWVFPNITVGPRSYLVVAFDSGRPASFGGNGGINTGFGLNDTGDHVLLYNGLGTLIDSLRFGPQVVDLSIGAIPTGGDSFVLTTPTPGAPNAAQSLGEPAVLRINEWMANPGSGDDWFELFNPGSIPVQLTGLYFVDSNMEPSPVAPLSFIGGGRDGFLRFYADNSTNDNQVDFGLGSGASGDSIGLFTHSGTRIHSVSFGRQAEDVSQGSLPDGSNNFQTLNLATPGGSNLILYEGLRVNEVLSHSDPPYEDAVEFYNTTAAPINIGGWYLSNSRSTLDKYRIPDGTTVPAQGYLVLYENAFNGTTANEPFTFNAARGDRVVLAQAGTAGALTGYIVEAEFEAAERNTSFGDFQTSTGRRFVPLQSPTFGAAQPANVEQFRTGAGAANAAPKVGPVVISEIMYNPSTNTASADLEADPEEYIELTNISGSPVALYDPAHPENTWKLDHGINFTFPGFSSIPASASVLVVSFDPAVDTQELAAFRAKYSLPQNIPIHGPYSGKLGNGGEAVGLYRPDPPQEPPHPDAGLVPYIVVDRIDYLDESPWPASADGLGHSLQRISLTAFGNDPGNWQAAAPAPGQTPGGSELRVNSVSYSNGTATMTFASTPGRQYRLQYRTDLNSSSAWQDLQTVTATGSTMTLSDSTNAPRRFYRVQAST